MVRGWFAEMGFSDFAGSTLVRSTGGWAALAGAVRRGKHGPAGRVSPGANLPLATPGALRLGWFGFNGGSQLAFGSAPDASAIVYVNANLAAAADVVVAMPLTQALYKKMDLTLRLNGAIGGLATAGPDLQRHGDRRRRFDRVLGAAARQVDDAVGAIPAHLRRKPRGRHLRRGRVPGPGRRRRRLRFRGQPDPPTVLKVTIGVRPGEEAELVGLDQTELGLEAYSAADRSSADASPRRSRTAPRPLLFV